MGSHGNDGRGKRGLALCIIANEFGVGCKREKGTRRNPRSGARATGWTTSMTLDGENSRGQMGCSGAGVPAWHVLSYCAYQTSRRKRRGSHWMPPSVVWRGDTELIVLTMTLEEITSQRQDRKGTSSGALLREKSGGDDKEPSVGNLPEARVMNHVTYKA